MRKDLSNNLILRSLSEGHAADQQNLPEFYERVFKEDGDDEAHLVKGWTRNLMQGHPTVTLDDMWVVVDAAKDDAIVSALLLIPQTWQYEDVPIGVGRVEIVATDKEYRRRGLVRDLFGVVHERSAERGHLMQGITGIPYFYRQFGYTMAVDLGVRSVLGVGPYDPQEAEKKPHLKAFSLRPATEADIPDMIAFDAYQAQQALLHVPRDEALFRYELSGMAHESVVKQDFRVIVRDDKTVGYIALDPAIDNEGLYVGCYVVGPDSSVLETFSPVVHNLQKMATEAHSDKLLRRISFDVSVPQAVDELVGSRPTGGSRDAYAWYVRVPDLPAFMQRIAPVLERRLRGSGAHRYTGEVKVDFYRREGLVMQFEQGCLKDAQIGPVKEADAAFPYDLFLNVLFGHHSPQQLRTLFPDAWTSASGGVLLNSLFPQKRSSLVPIA